MLKVGLWVFLVKTSLWQAKRKKFPYSIECKNQERVNVWESYKQALENSGDYEPIVDKKNHHKPLVVIDAEAFIKMHKDE